MNPLIDSILRRIQQTIIRVTVKYRISLDLFILDDASPKQCTNNNVCDCKIVLYESIDLLINKKLQ